MLILMLLLAVILLLILILFFLILLVLILLVVLLLLMEVLLLVVLLLVVLLVLVLVLFHIHHTQHGPLMIIIPLLDPIHPRSRVEQLKSLVHRLSLLSLLCMEVALLPLKPLQSRPCGSEIVNYSSSCMPAMQTRWSQECPRLHFQGPPRSAYHNKAATM
jgi:hypothetical protein